MSNRKNEFKRRFYILYFKVKNWNWELILFGLISIEIALIIFCKIHFNTTSIDVNKSLELILTFNGLFSAILVTYFFSQISRILDFKKEDYKDAVLFSQKVTDFRRILKRLTDYYGVWNSDDCTKSLFLTGKYKNVDYFDAKLSSISDYEPKEIQIINDLYNDKRYHEGQSDLYLAMISLVENRKKDYKEYDSILYKNYLKQGVYNLKFISNCVEIDYAGRMAYWFRNDYNYIRYNNLSKESRGYILELLERIDPKKFKKAELNNDNMAELCEDMNEHYFKELQILLLRLDKGLSEMSMIVYIILIMCLTIGVLLPFLTYFVFEGAEMKKTITELLIGLNFALLFFFIFGLYNFIKKELKYIS